MRAQTIHREQAHLDPDHVEALAERLRGPLLRAGEDGYDEARAVWNGMIDKRPALIVRAAGAADVMDAVRFAREHKLLLAVRGGSHNVAGHAVCDGGLVIDLSPMDGVRVDPSAQIARVEGGATWGDVDRETQAFGLATPGGVVSTTGVAGLTLGGGIGWLRNKYGLSCDNLVSADVVSADGELVTASADENSDLFWGLRGGGGNFGVVTSFEFELHEVGPEVAFAAVMYPQDEAGQLLPAWRDFMAEAPDEVSSQAILWSVPQVEAFPEEAQGHPVFVVGALYSGDPEEGKQVLGPLRELSDPVLDMSGVMPYTAVQASFDPFYPEGELQYYWKSTDLEHLGDEVIDALAGHAAERPSPRTHLIVWHQGGAMRRVGPDETAFGDRSASYLLTIDSTWPDPAQAEENVAWTREVWQDMQRFSGGGLYLNFPGLGEEGEDLVRSAYGSTYDRLVDVKNRWDPENLFRMNQNIEPTG